MHNNTIENLKTEMRSGNTDHKETRERQTSHESTHICPHRAHHEKMRADTPEYEENHQHARRSRWATWSFWTMGLGSLAWLLFRSGPKPRRLAYPCQQTALMTGAGFLGYLASLLGMTRLYHRLKHRAKLDRRSALFMAALTGGGILVLLLLVFKELPDGFSKPQVMYAQVTLPSWTSPTAVSNVFAVPNVPVPDCSLDGGTLPITPPCNAPSYALRDEGIYLLVNEMEKRGDYFYKTAVHPTGVVGADDVVVIKANNQWGGDRDGSVGRLATNTDLLKGLIWAILQHPDGFSGEVVIAENTQDIPRSWDISPANAEDPGQSFQDVIDAFSNLGYPVSIFSWNDLNEVRISGGNISAPGYPAGEYINGNNQDAYILLEDSAATGVDELSYPKFQTSEGAYVSMRHGIWNGTGYDRDKLTFINMPTLKRHDMAGATIAWKNLIGYVTIYDYENRYGGWSVMHDFYWGYWGGSNTYGLIGREIAQITAPDLHVVDAIWVAIEHNYSGATVRQDVLLASRDPFAVDWYASEYALYAIGGIPQGVSAARAGTFRNATRVNQNAAELVWPGGNYPYIDLLDSYDGDTPSDDERNQMNVYLASDSCEALTEATIDGPVTGFTDMPHSFTAVTAPMSATIPIAYTWSPEPDSGQGTAASQYQWSVPGEYVISLTAENCGGSVVDTHVITVENQCETLTGVTINGASVGFTDTLLSFTAVTAPISATIPITYVWSPTPNSGEGTETAQYEWFTPGAYTVTVTAENCGGNVVDAHVITIPEDPPNKVFLPLTLRSP